MKPLLFKKPKDVQIEESKLGHVAVSLHDAKGKYHYFIIDADATVYVANPPDEK